MTSVWAEGWKTPGDRGGGDSLSIYSCCLSKERRMYLKRESAAQGLTLTMIICEDRSVRVTHQGRVWQSIRGGTNVTRNTSPCDNSEVAMTRTFSSLGSIKARTAPVGRKRNT